MADTALNEATFSASDLDHLKCISCKRYLSFGPITRVRSGYHCGRCATPAKEEKDDILMVALVGRYFPCNHNGCEQKFLFGEDIKEHEEQCPYNSFRYCPLQMVAQCEWSGKPCNVLEHVSTAHKDNMLTDIKFVIKLDYISNTKLYCKQGLWFVITYSQNGKTDDLEILVSLANGQTLEPESSSYSVSLISLTATNIRIAKTRMLSQKIIFYKGDIQNIVKTSSDVYLKLHLPNVPRPTSIQTCGSCESVLEAFCFTCDCNVFLCQKCCSEKSEMCTMCDKYFVAFRNSIVQLEPNKKYPCLNITYGCNFIDLPSLLEDHYVQCQQNYVFDCPLELNNKPCYWKGFLDSLCMHVPEKHESEGSKKKILVKDVLASKFYKTLMSCTAMDPIVKSMWTTYYFILTVKHNSGVIYVNVEDINRNQPASPFNICCKDISIDCSPKLKSEDDFYKYSKAIVFVKPGCRDEHFWVSISK